MPEAKDQTFICCCAISEVPRFGSHHGLSLMQPQFPGEGAQEGSLLVFEDRRGRPSSRAEEESDEDHDDIPAKFTWGKGEPQSHSGRRAQDIGSEEDDLKEDSDDDEDAPEALPSKHFFR